MNDNAELLRRFAEDGSQAAFTQLVARTLPLVYGAALRQTGGDAQLAQDVTQGVYLALACRAAQLQRHAVLTGWLYTTTRFLAAKAVRGQVRRQRREQEAHDMNEILSETDAGWEQLRPVIDEAMHELGEKDRSALLLRFFEGRSLAEVGAAIGLAENAARMRVERALEKLRVRLADRGITSTATALGIALVNQPAIAIPMGLAASAARTAIAGAADAGGALTPWLTFMSITKIGGGLALVGLAFFAGLLFRRDGSPAPARIPDQTKLVAGLRTENAELKSTIDRLEAEHTVATNELVQARAKMTEVESQWQALQAVRAEEVRVQKQRAMLNNLRQLAAARDQFHVENGGYPGVDDLVGGTKYIKALNAADGEDYSQLDLAGRVFSVTSPTGLTVKYDAPPPPPRTVAMKKAVAAYQTAHNGETPSRTDTNALAPYFEDARDAADFVEWASALNAQKAAGR